MRLLALAILMALISVQTADAAVTFGRDRLRVTTKTAPDPATPLCPAGTTLTNLGTDYLCVAKPKCTVASDVVKDGVCAPQ